MDTRITEPTELDIPFGPGGALEDVLVFWRLLQNCGTTGDPCALFRSPQIMGDPSSRQHGRTSMDGRTPSDTGSIWVHFKRASVQGLSPLHRTSEHSNPETTPMARGSPRIS